MRRIFLSIPTPPELLEQITAFRSKHEQLPVRWLPDHNLHLTLIPPMEVSEELFQYFTTALTAMATPEPFALHFHHASFGPSETAPRLIWATGDTTPELTQLKETLEKTITYKPDHNFLPHITLARFSQTDFEMSPLKDLHEDIHWKMLVEEFVIMESKQLPTGSDYPVLARFPLTGTQQ